MQADWGMRILSSSSAEYSSDGYHFGSVWPLFTGWASVAEYRYHRELAAYLNLRANALLALDGSDGSDGSGGTSRKFWRAITTNLWRRARRNRYGRRP